MGLALDVWAGDELGRLYSPAVSCPPLGHLPTRSEDCTIIVDAMAGCGAVFPCNISVAVAGKTEANSDFISI